MADSPDHSPQLASFRADACPSDPLRSHHYVTEGNLSVAAPLLKAELSLSASHLAFCLQASLPHTPPCNLSSAGVDRFDVNRVLARISVVVAGDGVDGVVRGFAMLL